MATPDRRPPWAQLADCPCNAVNGTETRRKDGIHASWCGALGRDEGKLWMETFVKMWQDASESSYRRGFAEGFKLGTNPNRWTPELEAAVHVQGPGDE